MFNIIQSGNVVNIDSPDVDFDITVSLISGTAFQVANIEAIGYDWEVTSSGTMMMANVKLIPRDISSGGFWFGGNYGKMLYGQWVKKQTMNDVTSLDPTLLESVGHNIDLNSPRLEMTSKYVFIQRTDASFNPYVTRHNIPSGTSVIYDPTTADISLVSFCVYDDDNIYVVETNSSDETINLRKVTFTYDSYSVNDVYSWVSDDDVFDGYYYTQINHFFTGRVKSGVYDSIVVIWVYEERNSFPYPLNDYMFKFIIHNTFTLATSEQWKEPSSIGHVDLSSIISICTSPSFYQSKLIFSITPEWNGYPDPWPDPYPWICTFILDISTNSITRIEYEDSSSYYITSYIATSTIDYPNNIYYFPAYFDDFLGGDGYYLFSMNISSPVIVMGSLIDQIESWQGLTKGYCIDDGSVPGTVDVMDVPSMTGITTVDVLCTNSDSACVVDIEEGLIWNVKSDRLQGKTIYGPGLTRDITVTWAGATIPFTYPLSRRVWIRICNGNAAIMVFSKRTSPTAYQQDFYLLKETP
jgi:hypothetical protein